MMYNNWDKNSLSGSIILSADLLDNIFIPSIYYKYSNEEFSYLNSNSQSINGFGADLKLVINKLSSIYAGYSQSESDYIEIEHDNVETFEAGVNYSRS